MVPPIAAEAVAVAKVSAFISPDAVSCSMWQWLSTPPGRTSRPDASISAAPGGEPATDRRHLLARNPDVGVEDAGRGGDRAATDNQVELGHRRFRAAAARRTSRRGSSHLTSCGRK